ncbi:ABC transporter ATP-binding protein [Microbacterium rhizophilus]|uniref:ABC transporter ATP-binding protein n=1 Tax=Microbacterium rhizophilus TaxID=3138934 RepID=UPI0031EADEA7
MSATELTTAPVAAQDPAVRDASALAPLVDVAGLNVDFPVGRGWVRVVRDVSFRIHPGECLALVGESGSGKSVTSRSLVGLAADSARVTADRLELEGRDVRGHGERDWRGIRGSRVGFVLQDALASLDALRHVGAEISETLELHTSLTRAERADRVIELLTDVGVPEPEIRARQYPYELSGGLRQRALIASAIAADPQILIADEPTTALDATVAAQILQLLERLKRRAGATLVVSHDLAVVARIADRIAVMRAGEIVEQGTTESVLYDPQHAYTKQLLAAIPARAKRGARLAPTSRATRYLPPEAVGDRVGPAPRAGRLAQVAPQGTPLVEVRDLAKTFRGPDGTDRRVLHGVDFALHRGETLGIVGESGSGKTTAARIALGAETATSGQVLLAGRDVAGLGRRERAALRLGVQAVSQDPLGSFDPRYTVRAVLGEALRVAGYPRAARTARALELLDLVGLDRATLDRRPLELSGGMRQRVAIARALATSPDVIVADEPVSALDVSVQAQILDLLVDLQRATGVAILFISHDLAVVHHLADRVLVMSGGRVVESGDVERVFTTPEHAYTRELLAAIPHLDERRLAAAPAAPADPPAAPPAAAPVVGPHRAPVVFLPASAVPRPAPAADPTSPSEGTPS